MTTTKPRVAIHIASQYKGFLASLAQLLSKDFYVFIIAQTPSVKAYIDCVLPELSDRVSVYSDFKLEVETNDIISECLRKEKEYDEFFSMLISQDRGLGKGYLFNADRHPDILRSWWSHEDKLKAVLRPVLYFEKIVGEYAPDAVVSVGIFPPFAIVARKYDILYLALLNARFGNSYMWVENEYLENSRLTETIRTYVEQPSRVHDIIPNLVQQAGFTFLTGQKDFSYGTALLAALRRLMRDAYARTLQIVTGRYHKDGYRFLGWVPPILRRPFSYRFFLRYGVKPEDLKKYRLVYFPLHMEPEVTLLSGSPEFNNSLEALTWISKSLPADTLLVVKENPLSFGIRSKQYYNNLRRIGNVVLADPRVHSWDWIKAATVVATITGTAGFEAVYFGKPVLTFGMHQAINHLPTVRYACCYSDVKEYVSELLELRDSKAFDAAKRALYCALMDISFELPGYEKIYGGATLHLDLARKAVTKLQEQYPEVFAALDYAQKEKSSN